MERIRNKPLCRAKPNFTMTFELVVKRENEVELD